jgi:peptidoglycan hydrolase-like protein with peptidoglycan-binding domain
VTLPLGGVAPSTAPAAATPSAPPTGPPVARSDMPIAPATEPPPVTVAAADFPLYTPPEADLAHDTMQMPGIERDLALHNDSILPSAPEIAPAEADAAEESARPDRFGPDASAELGERVLAAARSSGARPPPRSSSAVLRALADSAVREEDAEAVAGPWLGPFGRLGFAPSATALFNSLTDLDYPMRRRDALRRLLGERFQVLARPGNPVGGVQLRPGNPVGGVQLRPGDLLVRVARGESWGHVAIIASPRRWRHEELARARLRGEGYPQLAPGRYVHVVELGPWLRTESDRFARRLCDAADIVLPDTLLVRLLPQDAQTSETAGEEPAAPLDAPGAGRPPTLRKGASGNAVRRAQRALNRIHADTLALGLPGLPGCLLPEDGRFGTSTESAVIALQQQVLSDPAKWDGVIGPETWAQLDLLAGGGARREDVPVESVPSDPQFIRWIQTTLNQLMHAGLEIDGRYSPRTRAAVRAFQSARGLDSDGIVGPRTEAALRAGGAGRAITLPTRCTGIPERQVLDHFEFGRAEVLPRHQPQILNLAFCILQSQRSRTPITTLTIIGHTDPVGGDEDNVALGRRRAEAVRDQINAAIARISGRPARLVVTVESRGERDQVPGDPGLSRRVEVVAPFAFPRRVPPPEPPPVVAATIEIVLDHDNDTVVDQRSPVATFTRFGLWNQAYDAAGNIRNGQAEADNFVGGDRRRFYFRVRDPAATTSHVTATWRTLRGDARTNADAPASQDLTLVETAAGSRIYVSRAVMLVTDDTDANQPTHSGLAPPLSDAGVRNRGQSNHRLRRASIDGFVRAEYRPAGRGVATVTLPILQRTSGDASGCAHQLRPTLYSG